jgi:hypothetical protein
MLFAAGSAYRHASPLMASDERIGARLFLSP